MKTNALKSYFINMAFIMAFSIIHCFTAGVLQIASGMIVSVLLGYSVTKHHYLFVSAQCALVLAVVTGIYGFLGGMLAAFSGAAVGVILVLLGVGLGLSTNLRLSVSGTVIMCSLIYLANVIIGFAVIGENLSYNMMLNEMEIVLTESLQVQYAGSPEIISMADEIIRESVAILYRFMPSFFVCSAGVSGLILTFVYKKIMAKLNKDIKQESLSTLRAERSAGVLFIVTVVIALSMQDALIFDALLNLIVILCFIFFVCGLSYIDYSMRHKGKNRTFRTITVLIILPLITMLFAVPAVVIAGVGFVDSLVDFRKKHSLEEDNDGIQ